MNVMLAVLDRLRPATPNDRTRLLMVGAVIGAVLALTISVAFASTSKEGAGGGPVGSGPEGGGLASPDAAYGLKYSFDAPVGTCLNWESDDGSDMRQVDCAKAHVFEVSEIVDVGDSFPAGSPLPGVDEWRELSKKQCTKGAEVYLDGPLDPDGKLQVSALRPNKTDWKRGNRELRCGLWRIGPGGSLQATRGPAVEADQSDIWATGTCLGLDGKAVADPVPCTEKHSYEMISIVDLSKEFDDYPTKKKQDEWLSETCAKAAKSYSGGKNLEKLKLIVHWDTRGKESWKAGSHLVNCKVGALLDDKSGLAGVTGSIKSSGESKSPPTTSKKKSGN